MPKKIYLIGSLRNERVPLIAEELRGHGHEVFDDWFGAGHEADDMWQRYENGRKRSYRDALAGHAAQHIFHFDKKHIDASDAVILVLPAGKSGHLEFGYARGIGKESIILLDGEPERFDVMYNFAHLVTSDLREASEHVSYLPPSLPANSGAAIVIAELQSENHAFKSAYRDAFETIARMSYMDAQGGEDAMAIRNVAMDFIEGRNDR